MEFLKQHLTPETYEKLTEELKDKKVKIADLSSGEYVSSAKYQTLEKDVETYKTQLQQRDNDLETLKAASTLSEEQKKNFEELQTKYNNEKSEWEAQLQKNAKDSAIEIAVAKSGTLDPVALKAHISAYVESAEFKDGQIVGLEEHISKRLNEDLKHLTGEIKPTGKEFKTPPKPESTLADAIRSKINGKEDK